MKALSTISQAREARLRRSLKRLGYELVDAERGQFYIRRAGFRVNETADLFGLDLVGIEAWIKEQCSRKTRVGSDMARMATARKGTPNRRNRQIS